MESLTQRLAAIRDLDQIAAVLCRAVRERVGADGATFVLRAGDRVRYLAEDAIAPLWAGQDFPIDACISGWSMLRVAQTAIPDIGVDPRIPQDTYRATFVRSLVMTPILGNAAIGAYWATTHVASDRELVELRSIARTGETAILGQALAGKRVLIIDDTADAAELLGMVLEGRGATVAIAVDGAEGLRLAQAGDYDLIISDIGMPIMDGYELMRRLRAIDRYRETPAIAVTGYGRSDDVERATAAGFTAHVTKPVDVAQLIALARG